MDRIRQQANTIPINWTREKKKLLKELIFTHSIFKSYEQAIDDDGGSGSGGGGSNHDDDDADNDGVGGGGGGGGGDDDDDDDDDDDERRRRGWEHCIFFCFYCSLETLDYTVRSWKHVQHFETLS